MNGTAVIGQRNEKKIHFLEENFLSATGFYRVFLSHLDHPELVVSLPLDRIWRVFLVIFFLPPNLTEIDDVTLGFQGIGKFTEFYRVWPTSATIEARVYRVLLGLQLDSLFNKSSGSFTEFDDVTLGFVGIGTFTEFYRVFTGSTTIEAWVYRVLLGFQLDSLEKGSSGWVGVSPAHPPGGALSETARPTPLAATPTSFDCTRR